MYTPGTWEDFVAKFIYQKLEPRKVAASTLWSESNDTGRRRMQLQLEGLKVANGVLLRDTDLLSRIEPERSIFEINACGFASLELKLILLVHTTCSSLSILSRKFEVNASTTSITLWKLKKSFPGTIGRM